MKKIISYLSIGAFILSIASCQEDFLEKYPTDKIASETFWKTEKDVDQGLAGVYNVMVNRSSMNHRRCTWDGLSDIGYGYNNFTLGLIEATSGSLVSSIYTECYQGISRCNIFLYNVDKAAEVDQNKIKKVKAEVLFLRAKFYFTLTEFYGGVPLYTTPPTLENANVEKSTKEQVVAQILADIESAIANLPDEPYTGHAVKGSALALKAQVLMHNGKWAEAASAAKQVMASGKFSLYNNFPNIFLSAGQENNPEIIFSVKYQMPNNGNSATNAAPELIFAHSYVVSPIQEFVDAFECTDGLPINQSPIYDPQKPLKNRDPRLLFTLIDHAGYKVKGDPIGQKGETRQTDYSVEKMVDWKFMPASWSLISDQDYVLFRYAQVLLMYAECQNEASGPDQSVYDAINAIRTRPGVNMPVLPAGLDKAAMREKIRHERAVELGMEGLRYWDIKRWKTAETVIPKIKNPNGLSRVFNPAKHYLFPFPQSELDRNPKLKQNPGY